MDKRVGHLLILNIGIVLLALMLIFKSTAGFGITDQNRNPKSYDELFQLSDRLVDLTIDSRPEGLRYKFVDQRDQEILLSADEFTNALFQQGTSQGKRTWLHVLFDISSWSGILWVSIGFLGQILFSGRMLIQWIASEQAKKSVVPTIFWWMSLFGSIMLLSYFLWRTDIVGIIGQLTGFLIYARNLWFIYFSVDRKVN